MFLASHFFLNVFQKLMLGRTDGRSNGVLWERESGSADLFGRAREKALIFLLPKLVVLPEKGRDSRLDGRTDLACCARSAKSGRGRGCTLHNLVVDGGS